MRYGRLYIFFELELYSVEVWMNTADIYCQSKEKFGTESDVLVFSLETSESEADERYL
jgi:hypothetical protein